MDVSIIWDYRPGRNVDHVAERGLTPDEVDEIIRDDTIPTGSSRSTGRPLKEGYTSTGKYIVVVWDELNDDPRMIYPVTAYTPDPT